MDTYKVQAYNIIDDITEDVGEGFSKKQVDDMINGCIYAGYYEVKPKVTTAKFYIDDVNKIMYSVMREAESNGKRVTEESIEKV